MITLGDLTRNADFKKMTLALDMAKGAYRRSAKSTGLSAFPR